jgi:hypothetical protein
VLHVRDVMRSLRARWVALLTALAVLLPMSAFGRTHYFCRMMNRVADTCCCETHDPVNGSASESASYGPRVRSSDCCERLTTGTQNTALRAEGTDFHVRPPAFTAMVPVAVYVVPKSVAVRALPVQARAPPGVGPPLFIVHCSLLT